MSTSEGADLFSPAPNSRRAMALCVAMVVAADGRFSRDEESFVMSVALPTVNELGDQRARARGLKPQTSLNITEFRLIFDACMAAIGDRGVPDDQFVARVLATVTEREYRKSLFDLMLRTAVADGLDPARGAGILRFCLEEWRLDPADWPELSRSEARP